MAMQRIFNKSGNHQREIVLDVETTGLFTSEGHRMVEIAAVEMLGNRPTGREFYALINPGRDIPEDNSKIHGITNEKVQDKPLFAQVAAELRQFIGDSTVVITCRTKDEYTLDIAFMNAELQEAGQPKIPESQWVNVRRWSETMFGEKSATLDKVLDRYGVSRKERDENGHGALLDARLLAEVYPKLLKDYLSSGATPVASVTAAAKHKPNTPSN
jgi:DNA polymerase III subunit epsilon